MAVSHSITEYHLDADPTYEEDLLEEMSIAASRTPDIASPSRACQVEVISKYAHIICTPYIPRGRRAHGRSHSEPRYS